jgi:hypothetical protein
VWLNFRVMMIGGKTRLLQNLSAGLIRSGRL